MKKILVICGHPDHESLNAQMAKNYFEAASASPTNEVKQLHLRNLDFNYNLEHGYNRRTELEPDLLKAQQDILWADHLVWFFPTWWGNYPAVMKAFIDRVFLPGFAFKYRENSVWWDKYLTNKTAHIVSTMHTPYWYYRLIYGNPSIKSFKRATLKFCGVTKIKTTILSTTQNHTTPAQKWLDKAKKMGQAAA